MGHPKYIYLGFFEVDSDAVIFGNVITNLRIASGPETERFDGLVDQLFGELPNSHELSDRCGVYRDDKGIFTVSLWSIDKQANLYDAILDLHDESECQIYHRCGHFIRPYNRVRLATALHYYIQEYKAEVQARNPGAFKFCPDKKKHSKPNRETGRRRHTK